MQGKKCNFNHFQESNSRSNYVKHVSFSKELTQNKRSKARVNFYVLLIDLVLPSSRMGLKNIFQQHCWKWSLWQQYKYLKSTLITNIKLILCIIVYKERCTTTLSKTLSYEISVPWFCFGFVRHIRLLTAALRLKAGFHQAISSKILVVKI